jgi:hypothetical protein
MSPRSEPRRHPVEVEETACRDRQGDARIDQGGLAEANTLWTQATAAQSSGDLEQAVGLGRQTKEKADGMLAALGMTPG